MKLKQREDCITAATQACLIKLQLHKTQLLRLGVLDTQLSPKLAFHEVKGKTTSDSRRSTVVHTGAVHYTYEYYPIFPLFPVTFLIQQQITLSSQRRITAYNCQVTLPGTCAICCNLSFPLPLPSAATYSTSLQ